MLTATYSLVAIKNEQNSMRGMLQKLQQSIQNAWKSLQEINLASLEAAFNRLTQFDDYCRNRRKVQAYLIPTVRRATHEADSLLAELEGLSERAMTLLQSIKERLHGAVERDRVQAGELCRAMELYCHKLLRRLEKEEKELFPLVCRVFSVNEWFCVAEKFLSVDGQTYRGKRHSQPPPALEAVPASEQRR